MVASASSSTSPPVIQVSVGDRVQVKFGDGVWYGGAVRAPLKRASAGKISCWLDIMYDDGERLCTDWRKGSKEGWVRKAVKGNPQEEGVEEMLEEEERTEEQAKKKAKPTAKPTKSASKSTTESATKSATKSTTKSTTKKVQVPKKTVALPPAQPLAHLLHASIKVYSGDAQCPYFVGQVIDLEVNDTLRRARVLYGPDDDEWICLNEMKWEMAKEPGGGGIGKSGKKGGAKEVVKKVVAKSKLGGKRPLKVNKKKRLINFSKIFAKGLK